jgi:hypothetical protein
MSQNMDRICQNLWANFPIYEDIFKIPEAKMLDKIGSICIYIWLLTNMDQYAVTNRTLRAYGIGAQLHIYLIKYISVVFDR